MVSCKSGRIVLGNMVELPKNSVNKTDPPCLLVNPCNSVNKMFSHDLCSRARLKTEDTRCSESLDGKIING